MTILTPVMISSQAAQDTAVTVAPFYADRSSVRETAPQLRYLEPAGSPGFRTGSPAEQTQSVRAPSIQRGGGTPKPPVQRQVRDVRLDVSVPTAGRGRADAHPVLATLQTAVKTVEEELQKAKELWTKPELDITRLTDQMYKELTKRIRLEQQRRGF